MISGGSSPVAVSEQSNRWPNSCCHQDDADGMHMLLVLLGTRAENLMAFVAITAICVFADSYMPEHIPHDCPLCCQQLAVNMHVACNVGWSQLLTQ